MNDSERITLIKNQASEASSELIQRAKLKKGDVLVVGCSSSEIIGSQIGRDSSIEEAVAVFSAIYEQTQKAGVFLACQCCEHLNRAIVIETELAKKLNLEICNVVPFPKAGGSFATTAYRTFKDPCVVEHIKADAGLDIGQTLIGMHLKDVAVPVRLKVKNIGQAVLTAARTRAKFIGGMRANYNEDLF